MKKLFIINLSLVIGVLFFSQAANACTGFGTITPTGTIIGKNRDYYYVPQKFALMSSLPQFNAWYGNPYHHNNAFYAITSAESISMGVNQNGLTAVEQDALKPGQPQNAKEYKSIQQEEGTPDGLVLYGVLQNFNNVDEIIPYLSKIFGDAAPDFYQFADAKKLLSIEVSNDKNSTNFKHKFIYHIFNKQSDYFTHTNTYLNPEFISENNLITNQKSLDSSNHRLKTITQLMSQSKVKDINTAASWLLDTKSNISNTNDLNQCLNTSLFRSNLANFKSVDANIPNDKIFGTVASLIVSNNGNLKNSYIYVMMLNSITTQSDGKQLIKYRLLNTTLAKLFSEKAPQFTKREFVRNSPANGICS